ncbi:unnamed protein product [Aspergillus oryzae]|nr:unnamed protein product [Aspergillus oryzae]
MPLFEVSMPQTSDYLSRSSSGLDGIFTLQSGATVYRRPWVLFLMMWTWAILAPAGKPKGNCLQEQRKKGKDAGINN